MSEYSFAHVSPPRQSCDRLENLFFRSPRDKYSVYLPKNQNFQDYRKNKEDLASKLFSTYRADRGTKPWEDTRSIFPNNIWTQRLSSKSENSFPSHQENNLEERRSLVKTPNSVDRRYKFANPQEAYYPDEFGVPEIKHGLHFLPQDLNTDKTTEDERFFNNLDEDSLPSWTPRRLKQAEDFLEVYPARDKQTIITEDDNEQINHNSHSGLIFPQDLNISKPTKYGKPIDNWDFATRNPQESEEIKQFQKVENNWQFYPREKFDILFANDYSDEENINQEYFKDKVDKDTIKIGRGNYNPYNFSQNTDIWRATQDKELSDNLNFMSENLHEIEKEKQEIYSQDKYFQDKENEDVLFKHRTNANTDQMTRTPVNSYKSFLSRYFNIFNNAKHSAQSSEESQESTKYSSLHKNPVEERNSRVFDNKAVAHDEQDLLKDIFDLRDYNEYNIPAVNTGAETELTKDSLTLEDAGADKDRSKKSATTFCVEVRSEKEEQVSDPKFSILPLPAPAPTSLTIVQPAPVPAPTSMAIVQPAPAPAPAPAPVTIVQPAPAPCAPEPFSVNVIQPAPAQTETIFVQPTQPAPQPQVANIVLPPQPAPQLAPQIVVPAPAPAPTQYLNIQPAAPCAPQQTSYFLQTPTVSQPVQYHYLQPQAPQIVPQPTVTVIQPEPIKLEQEKFIKPQVKPMSLVQVR
ncbi:hypothetical protein X777_14208 [Ooceraea biroi]|uniref:Uncharacterized protein n=1 Tax=Ooceraea biroi TaxID=2015173 RepID=A0A026VZ36_OOCBI|nr:hypothetical protein X777_14208 [Ooceraea biroi]